MIVEFDIDAEILRPSLEDTTETTATITDVVATKDSQLRGNFVVQTENFDEFKHNIEHDPTVSKFCRYSDREDRKEYRVHFADSIPDIDGYDAVVSCGGIILRVDSNDSGWTVKSRFPSREKYAKFLEVASNIGFDVRTRSLYGEPTMETQMGFGLTEPQKEAITVAKELGYFSFPQETTLDEISDVLGISRTAVSGRLHRGLDRLVANTISPGASGADADGS